MGINLLLVIQGALLYLDLMFTPWLVALLQLPLTFELMPTSIIVLHHLH
nr:hypothetical protein Q903MT_gene3403 [Picea sitchensis]